MQVLITRPSEQAAETAAVLAMMGHEAVISPVLEIAATGAAWPSQAIDCLIATSARAFQALSVAPDFPTLETRRLLPLFAVGETTLAAARAAGFFGPATVAPNVQDLVPPLLAHLHPGSGALYLAGRERKPDLETACAAAGTPLHVVETYRAVPATQLSDAARAALDEGSVGAALHYSRRSTAILVELMEADGFDPASLTHVAISEDAAGPLRALDLSHLRVCVAASPSESDMLDLLRDALPAS
jgi:uroporphyrinogen-III synthase